MSQRKRPKIVYVDDSTEQESVEKELAASKKPKIVELPASQVAVEQVAGKRPRRRKPSLILTLVLATMAITVLAAFIFIPVEPPKAPVIEHVPPQFPACLDIHPDLDWDYDFPNLECQKGALPDNMGLADLLLMRNVDYKQVIQVMEMAAQKNLPSMKAGMSYTLLYSPEKLQSPCIFVYEPTPLSFVLMNLQGNPDVHYYQRGILRKTRKELNVIIQTTLAEAMFNRESGLSLARAMEAAIKYKVDLFHLEPGDRFQLLYEESQYEGNQNEIGDLLAVHYRQNGEEGYAFYFEENDIAGFYDMDGRALKSGFLMAPLEYGRISSGYNLNRPDPISKSGKIMPHLGTDYAAPEGTPIMAVGEGVVTHAEFKGGNGNYVKLQHSDLIQTQYLHMSRFADGIEPGVFVRQGQVIGYVGSTGRSTGPHVCFRYWKNGQQVDHRKEKDFGVPTGLPESAMQAFMDHRDSILQLMTDI